MMTLTYLKMALRQFRRHKTYSIINVVGLSTGLAACFIILIYVRYQTSFDRYDDNLDNTYLVTTHKEAFGWTEPGTPIILGPTLRAEIPGVKEVARWDRRKGTLQYKEREFDEKSCVFADPELFNVLTLPLVRGNVGSIAGTRDFLVISEALARKYFGNNNPLGEVITLRCRGIAYDLKVTAVMKDIPRTSTLIADAIGPLYISQRFWTDIVAKSKIDPATSWTVLGVNTYVIVAPSGNIAQVKAGLEGLSKHYIDPAWKESYDLFPLKDVYFHSAFMTNNVFPQGDITNVYVYSLVAFLLLFIASINYLMLGLGRASLRTREVGVRKVFGAGNSDLFIQTLVEAVFMTILSLPVALVLVELLLQKLTGLLGTEISETYFHNWQYIVGFVILTISVGLVSGGYISIYIAKFNPTEILKGKLTAGSRKVFVRRGLMVSQMIVFLGLTLASIAIFRQLRLFQRGDIGFVKDQLVVFYPDNDEFGKTFDAFKNEIQQNPNIAGITGSNFLPMTESKAVSQFPKKGRPEESITIEGIAVDREFVETMGMKMTSGVSFHDRTAHSPGRVCILNQTAVRELGLAEPLGEEVGRATVIGVVADFNMHSLHERISPLRVTAGGRIGEVAVRITPHDIQATAKWIAEKGAKFNNGKPLEYETFDERLGGLYTQEHKFAEVMSYATGLAIFVACLGIFGMSVFVCQQKVKEIGIRKVLGASLGDVYYKLTREFVAMIFLSAMIAFPVALYLVNLWLQHFVKQVDVGLWDFIVTVAVDVVVVLATVSYQAIRAARANPILSLRYE